MLSELVEIALEAGAAILEVYSSETFQEQIKADGSPVTVADSAAEAIILQRLRAAFPAIAIVAEEEAAQGRVPETANTFFLVDPLDGTKEFLNRNGDFTVNIAQIIDGTPVAGVVYAPAHGLMFAGDQTSGARQAKVSNGKLGVWSNLAARQPPTAGLSVVASRSHMSPETAEYVARFKVADMVSAGSSLKFCRVAAGEADLYPRLGRTMEWDTAAGDAVLRAAGGGVYTLDGAALKYGKRRQDIDVDFANPWFVAAGRFNPFQLQPK